MRFRFHTVLPIDECSRRLEAATDRRGFFEDDSGSAPVVGRIVRHRFHLQRRAALGNPFAPHAYGSLKETDRGTSVLCSVRVPVGTVAFFTAQFGVILFVATMAVVPTPWSVPVIGASADLARGLGFPIIIGAGVLLIAFGRRLARGDDAELAHFVRDTLLAAGSELGENASTLTARRRAAQPTTESSEREKLVRRLWMGTGILAALSIAGLFVFGAYTKSDPEPMARYVFGSIAIAFGSQLVIFGPDHDRMLAKQFPGESGKVRIARAFGGFFIAIGGAMMLVP